MGHCEVCVLTWAEPPYDGLWGVWIATQMPVAICCNLWQSVAICCVAIL